MDLRSGRKARRVVEWLALPHWMAVFFLVAAIGALLVAQGGFSATVIFIPILSFFSLNLIAALTVRPALRRDAPLLLLHLGLLALVVLFAWGRLTYLDAAAAVSVGDTFEGQLRRNEHGPWHRPDLSKLRFTNEGFTVRLPAGDRFEATVNRVRWQAETGETHRAYIGDDVPLRLGAYRIYASRVRGFAPVFHWRAKDGSESLGQIQLDDNVGSAFERADEWRLPGGPLLWASMELEGDNAMRSGETRDDLGVRTLPHQLLMRAGDRRWPMRPGETMEIDGGRLTYVRLNAWLGYRVTYDPSRPWLLSVVLLTVGSMVWFYGRRVFKVQGGLK